MRNPAGQMMRTAAMLFPWLLLLGESGWGAEPGRAPTLSPDPKIQELIRRVIYAPDDHKEGSEAFKELKRLARKTPDVLAPQLIYYGVHASNEKEGVGMMGMMKHFASTSELRSPLIPLLESKDEAVRREVATWMSNIDGVFNLGAEANIMYYRETLLRHKEAPPAGLVKYVYDIQPSQALLLLGGIYSEKPKSDPFPRPLMWSDHVITTVRWRLRNRFLEEGDLEKARKELDDLSKHEGWYARRYVVEVIRGAGASKLGTPDIVDRLKKDTNPLVAESASLIE